MFFAFLLTIISFTMSEKSDNPIGFNALSIFENCIENCLLANRAAANASFSCGLFMSTLTSFSFSSTPRSWSGLNNLQPNEADIFAIVDGALLLSVAMIKGFPNFKISETISGRENSFLLLV